MQTNRIINCSAILIINTILIWIGNANCAPIPNDKTDEKKIINKFSLAILKSYGDRDAESILAASAFPWCSINSGILKNKDDLEKHLNSAFNRNRNPGNFTVESIKISTYDDSKKKFADRETKHLNQVVKPSDYTAWCTLKYPDPIGLVTAALIVRMVDGKPKLVGFGSG